MINLVGQNYNAREIIQNIFPPLVGVITSPMAADVCQRNNLSFVELIRPFAKLQNDAIFRDVSGTSVSIRGLHLNICDVDWRPPQTVLAKKMLFESVTNASNEKMKHISLGAGAMELEIPTNEPWFEQWRETFLTVQFPADHEFTRHFLSCLIVLCSTDPNILDTAQKLTQRAQQMQGMAPQKLPKWFYPSEVLNSYLVLHEGCQGDINKAQQSYELLKSIFGDNKCFLVQINSVEPTAVLENNFNDYWTPYIRRQAKTDGQNDQISAPKTPQDSMSVTSLPPIHMTVLTDAIASENSDLAPISHPLSPVQENAMEAINSQFSISNESIASQTINLNVWSAETENDNPYGCCLNSMDVENLRHFVQDYTVRALIPYVEHLVVLLNEAITNKKGVSKSLLSATKRWFVTSKPGASTSNQNAVIYTYESAELQTRKLGDLYFMFGHYNLAFQAYHQAKRDFNADSAWQYYAGALEMAAVSAFMLGTANRKTYDYMEDAIVSYLTVCKLPQFATRATLLNMECLKQAKLFNEAAKQLIRMTSEESDLRSALLLEQAAYCFLASQPPMPRKYAFHILLAGNRFSRAGQRKHAYRCYRQAQYVFEGRGWSLAEDHIQYTTAKHAYTLKKLDEASRCFAHLLRPGSFQTGQQQLNFLKEYIQTKNELLKRNAELGLITLSLPIVLQESIRVLFGGKSSGGSVQQYMPANNIDINSDLSYESLWNKMEEMIVITSAANKPFVFKPSQYLYTHHRPAAETPVMVQGETIELLVTLSNPIRCPISMNNIDILWQLKLDNDEILSNQCLFKTTNENPNKAAVHAAVKTVCTQSILLEESGEQTIFFTITPKLTGFLKILGLVSKIASNYEPENSLLGSLYFDTLRIKSVDGKHLTNQVLLDNKLSIKITPSVPSLNAAFTQVPTDLICGESVPLTMSLRNFGIESINEIYVCCDNPRWFTLLDKDEVTEPISILSSFKDLSKEKLIKDKEIRRQHVIRLLRRSAGECALKPQECINLPICIQAPNVKGDFTVRLLFYYNFPLNSNTSIKYRLIRHTWKFRVHECLYSEVSCIISNHLTNELSLNINIKNVNIPITDFNTEIYINELSLYSEEFKINPDRICYVNQMEIESGTLGDKCLKSSKCASFQCGLMKRNNLTINEDMTSADQALKRRLSATTIMPFKHFKDQRNRPYHNYVPNIDDLFGFLAKFETTYFNQNITTEEFNIAVANYEPHITVILNWTANVFIKSEQRIVHGHHFLKLHNLYEIKNTSEAYGPTIKYNLNKEKRENDNQDELNISEFASKINRNSEFNDNYVHYDELDDDYWEPNDNEVTARYTLEDEIYFNTPTTFKP